MRRLDGRMRLGLTEIPAMLIHSQSTGIVTRNGQRIAKGFAGNDSRPKVNPDHIHGYNNPAAQHLRFIGPLPQGLYKIAEWQDEHPGLGPIVAILVQVSGETFGRNNFRIHGASSSDPMNSSEGCIVLSHDDRVALRATGETLLQVVA
jgi:hypothetical protein